MPCSAANAAARPARLAATAATVTSSRRAAGSTTAIGATRAAPRIPIRIMRFSLISRARAQITPVWLIPLAPADQHLVGGGLEGEAEAEQALEGGGGVVPAVEPEHELV